MDAYILDTVRTPRGRGKASGSLYEVSPLRLASTVLAAIRDRNDLDTRLVEDVIFGVADPVDEQGADISRTAVLVAGYAQSAPGVQINRFCASGLEACNMAAAQVMAGQSEAAIGGGVESMSRIQMFSSGGALISDPLFTMANNFVPQGISADLIATKYGYSRSDVDAYAVESQARAAAAIQSGYFTRSIVPVRDDSDIVILDRDEYARPETTMQSLAALEPSFAVQGEKFGFDAVALQKYPEVERINHVHHAGNSSGIVDGAAAVLVARAEGAKRAGLKPRARIRAFGSVGSEPTIMLTGPSFAVEKALARAGMKPSDVDLFECNEAFAAVVLRFMDSLGLDRSRVNVNGGAIALGHPLGASGAMLLGTLLDELERRDLSTGVVTLCVGGGMGTAMVIERV
ncbi:MAG: acetyl-CoA C-acetyltransferase [Xanthobacteraceae bacterium]